MYNNQLQLDNKVSKKCSNKQFWLHNNKQFWLHNNARECLKAREKKIPTQHWTGKDN